MTLIPMRTVASQVAAELTEQISKRTWREWLPSERDLCQKMQVSRSTLRSALQQLQHDGVIEALHGVGHRIAIHPTKRKRAEVRSIALLAPEPISHLRPNTAHWIEDLKDQLHALGYELSYQQARSCYQTEPERALTRLLKRENHLVWILVLTNKAMQRWFAENEIPCVVTGSVYEGVALPSVDFDFRAICRHAAGVLIGAGHSRLDLLTHRPRTAGDMESEAGFHEAIEKSSRKGISGSVFYHDESLEGIGNTLRRLLQQKAPPTGLIVSNSNLMLTATTILGRRGIRVPEDMSLICKDDALFLQHVVPDTARYVSEASAIAKKILTQVLHQVQRPTTRAPGIRIFPRFHRGGSVAPPRADALKKE